MAIRFELVRQLPTDVGAVIVPACSDQQGDGEDWAHLRARGFEGRVDQVAALPAGVWAADGATPNPSAVVIAVGLGESASVDQHQLRRASAVGVRAASRHTRVANLLLAAVPDPAMRPAAAQAVAEGAVLGAYQFLAYKSSPEPYAVEEMAVVGTGGKRVQAALEVGARVADGVVLARDLVNEPGGSLTPQLLAEAAVEVAEREGLQITVMGEDDIVAAGLGGLLGVNRGSVNPPRFVELAYQPERPVGTLAVVGKGITFDSGGLSLKTATGMMTMKSDMAGAAAVIGAFSAMGAVSPRCAVRGYLPLTDNMPAGDATRPGDVLRMRNGTTVEVLNTDAEGRLVLADALSLAVEGEPDAILDLATLTGAVEVALGNRIAGLMGNNEAWLTQVQEAADRAGERVWPLPLPDDYRKRLDSDVADLRNIGRQPDGGSVVAGLFLREFVGGRPWAHLDIAGTAYGSEFNGELPKGGTGFGVRLVLEAARRFRPGSLRR